jgi:hypothetical protein
VSHEASWQLSRGSRSSGRDLIAGRFTASISIACSASPSVSGCGRIEHQCSTAWSIARMPVESISSIGVSSVAAGSRITVRGAIRG